MVYDTQVKNLLILQRLWSSNTPELVLNIQHLVERAVQTVEYMFEKVDQSVGDALLNYRNTPIDVIRYISSSVTYESQIENKIAYKRLNSPHQT